MSAGHRSFFRRSLYSLIAALLLVAFFAPEFDLPLRRAHLAILLDDSISMENGGADPWAMLGREYTSIPDNIDVSLIRFASDAVIEYPATQKTGQLFETLINQPVVPRFQNIDRTSTNIEKAIHLAIDEPNDPADAILLLSDAGETDGNAQAVLRRYGQRVPVFSLLDPSQVAAQPVWIARHSAPHFAKPGEPFWVTAELHSSDNTRVELTLQSGDGKTIRQYENLVSNSPRVIAIPVQLDRPGDYELFVNVADASNNGDILDTVNRTISIGGDGTVYLVSQNGLPEFENTVRASGRELHRLGPAQFARLNSVWRRGSVIVLDDIPVETLSDAGWRRLGDAVRGLGCGLVILGGPNSFANGGYRHSALEDLLPVVSEPANEEDTAAIMFVIDKSGSMAQADSGNARFAIARRALTRTVAQLARDDETGLIVFDDDTRLALPLNNRDADAIAFGNALPDRVGGGTRLAPAIQLAVEQLTGSEKQQRILVLLTDGFADDQALSASRALLRDSGIIVLAFAISAQADVAALSRLIANNNGSVHVVSELTGLPALVRLSIEQQRDLVQQTDTGANTGVIPSSSLRDEFGDWPDVSAYAVTRPRDQADVLLTSGSGDPLLALWSQGDGIVLALPAGLGSWANRWPIWGGWARFTELVLRRADTADASPLLHLDLATGPDIIRVTAQVLDDDLEWSRAPALAAWLTDPLGRRTGHQMPAAAAGRFEADLPASLNGIYTVTVQHSGSKARRRISRESHTEITAARDALQAWFDNGLVQGWDSDIAARLLHRKAVSIDLRSPLLLLALLLYLVVIIEERGRSLLSHRYSKGVSRA